MGDRQIFIGAQGFWTSHQAYFYIGYPRYSLESPRYLSEIPIISWKTPRFLSDTISLQTIPTNKNPWRTQDYLVYFTWETCEYVVKVFVDDLIKGLGPSFCPAKTWVYFTLCTRDLYMRKLFFSHLFVLHFLKTFGKGGRGEF